MGRWRRCGARALACAALALSACSAPVMGRVDSAELGTLRALAVLVDAADVATRLVGPWALDEPQVAIGLEPSEVAVLLVGLDDDALRAQVPALDLARPLTARLGAACEVPTDGRDRDLAIPPDAPVLRMAPEAGAPTALSRAQARTLDHVVLRGALDFGLCARAGESRVQPFGPVAELIPPSATIGGQPVGSAGRNAITALRLDRERLVLGVDDAVFLLRRGEAYVDRPGAALRVPSVAAARIASVVRIPSADGAERVLAVGFDGEGGAAWDVSVVGDDVTEVVTATRTPMWLYSATVTDAGTAVAVGLGGRVLVRRAGAPEFVVTARLGIALLTVITTPDPRSPIVVGSADARLFHGDAELGLFQEARLGRGARNFDVHSLAWTRSGDGVVLWAGSDLGLYRRVSGGDWAEYTLDLPLSAGRCAAEADGCGVRTIADRIGALAVDRGPGRDDRLFIQANRCTSLMVLNPRTRCAAEVSRDGAPGAVVAMGGSNRSIIVDDGVLTLVGDGVSVTEVELR